MALCPHCEATLETPLCCMSCQALLETEAALSPFQILNLERGWSVDPHELQQKLLRFTRLVHPDFFVGAEPRERELAERHSAAINAAHTTLSRDTTRADLLLNELGGPSEKDERQMPQAFLMEVIEWNETLEEARAQIKDPATEARLQELDETLKCERVKILTAVGAGLTPLPPSGAAELLEVRRDLNAVRYIDRALTELEVLRLEGAAS